MNKGKTGIALAFYATAAFVLAAFGQLLALIVLTGFVILAEKDEWLTKQCLQACCLVMVDNVYYKVVSLLQYPVSWIGNFITDRESGFYKFSDVYYKIFSIIGDFLTIAILVFAVLAILNVMRQKDAKIPVIAKVADWAYGIGGKSPVKKCPKCGAEVEGQFCDQCGTKLD